MSELKEFDLDLSKFEQNLQNIRSCQIEHGQNENCNACSMVSKCQKIKDFVVMQFDVNKQKLKQCQNSNQTDSCMDCELFFTCQIRHDFVRSTYEKMNEGRGGEFDF